MATLGLIFLIIILFFLIPLLSFGFGYLSGMFIKLIFGNLILAGLKLLGINISLDSVPLFFGTLSLIASFFRSPDFNNNKKSKS